MAYARIVVENWSEDLFDRRQSSGSILLRQSGSSRERVAYGLEVMSRPDLIGHAHRQFPCMRCPPPVGVYARVCVLPLL